MRVTPLFPTGNLERADSASNTVIRRKKKEVLKATKSARPQQERQGPIGGEEERENVNWG